MVFASWNPFNFAIVIDRHFRYLYCITWNMLFNVLFTCREGLPVSWNIVCYTWEHSDMQLPRRSYKQKMFKCGYGQGKLKKTLVCRKSLMYSPEFTYSLQEPQHMPAMQHQAGIHRHSSSKYPAPRYKSKSNSESCFFVPLRRTPNA